ncbi:MAG: GNAT family N-acetyltransferase [Amaricoccus sp.]
MTPESLARLHALAFDDTPRPWTASEFARLIAAPTTLFVSVADGFALGRAAAGEAELLTLAVRPDARRRGHGAYLLGQFEAAAATAGAEAVLIEVAVTNAAARALYARAGYAPVGRRPGYYVRRSAPPVDALVLRKAVGVPSDAAGKPLTPSGR